MSKCIKDLNIKLDSLKMMEEKMGHTLAQETTSCAVQNTNSSGTKINDL